LAVYRAFRGIGRPTGTTLPQRSMAPPATPPADGISERQNQSGDDQDKNRITHAAPPPKFSSGVTAPKPAEESAEMVGDEGFEPPTPSV
jgi:hypothetical protein